MFFFKKSEPTCLLKDLPEKSIAVVGTGCRKCQKLTQTMQAAVAFVNRDEKVFHITDEAALDCFDVLTPPAVVIDRKVVSAGRLLSLNEAVALLEQYR